MRVTLRVFSSRVDVTHAAESGVTPGHKVELTINPDQLVSVQGHISYCNRSYREGVLARLW